MENERELLELAAKAMGFTGYTHEWINGPEFIIPGENPITWIPSRDDGDCARMEAALDINVKWFDNIGLVNSWVEYSELDQEHYEDYGNHGGDKQAARRMASLRVAAEIGRAMQSDKR